MFTKTDIDDLVEKWHEGYSLLTLNEYIILKTRWSKDQFDHWVRTGEIP